MTIDIGLKELGEGGFGRVFLAKENYVESYVAIKQLKYDDGNWQQDIIH